MSWFNITQVHPQVYAIAEPHHWEEVISYVLEGKETLYLIDTGMGYESMLEAVRSLSSKKVIALLTHSHWDHIGSAHEFEDVRVFDNSFEKKSLQDGFHAKDIHELKQSFFEEPFQFKNFHSPGKQHFSKLQDLEIIKDQNFTIQVIHTPGHTPGSCCFWIPEIKLLFTGDTVYPAGEFLYLKESNVDDYKRSISKLVQLCGNIETLLFPGHNETTTDIKLLLDHQDALEGKTKPLQIIKGEDSYGKFVERKFDTFSLLLPQKTNLS